MENNIDFSGLDCLLENYPHLEEKAIVDFINGLSVMSDHLEQKAKVSAKGFSGRFFQRITGHTRKRQELIDGSFENSFAFIKDYIVSNEQRLAKNEHFLHQVMDGVSLISARLQDVVGETQVLREDLVELSQKVSDMEHSISRKMNYFELQNSAMAEKELALSVFASKDALFTPEQSLWMLLTRLRYGDFGAWLASTEGGEKHPQTVQKVMKSLRLDCIRILSEHTGRSPHALIDRNTLFANLCSADEVLSEALCLVSDSESSEIESVILMVNNAQTPAPGEEMPFVFSNTSIYEEMSNVIIEGEGHAAIH